MLHVKNAAGITEDYPDYGLVDVDVQEGTTSFATEAFMSGENDDQSVVLKTSDQGISWWID